jgi:hypothetical protein
MDFQEFLERWLEDTRARKVAWFSKTEKDSGWEDECFSSLAGPDGQKTFILKKGLDEDGEDRYLVSLRQHGSEPDDTAFYRGENRDLARELWTLVEEQAVQLVSDPTSEIQDWLDSEEGKEELKERLRNLNLISRDVPGVKED